jgi:DNA repair protein SbcD/Mre11
MRLLHTSDWHLGRSLHQADLSSAQEAFVDSVVATVVEERVDAVLLSGDVFDRALPPVEAMQLFDDALCRLRDAGAAVVVISGNHDAAPRLGDKSALLDPRVSIRTDPRAVGRPVVLEDAHGEVAVYGVPYLEPAAVRDALPGDDTGPGHTAVLTRAMAAVHADRTRFGRSVVLAHGWVTGGEASDSERDIAVGGVAQVPVSLFDGVDYVALGHLHRPQSVRDEVRYIGSPLPYSFSEAGAVKSSWLVELGPSGLVSVEAVPAPVHRDLVVLRGRLDELLASPALADAERCFVSATLTDPVRPVDAMAALQRRFPWCVHLAFAPEGAVTDDAGSYGARTRGRSDLEVAEAFVRHVGGALGDEERALLREALEHARTVEPALVAG